MRQWLKQYWAEVLFIFFCACTPLVWLRQGEYVLGHDSGWRWSQVDHFQRLWSTWSTGYGFGQDVSVFKGFLVLDLPSYLAYILTHSLSITQRFTFFYWFFAIMFSMYILLNRLFPHKKEWFLRVLGSVAYAFQFFLLQGWFITERAKFSIFVLLPLATLVSLRLSQNKGEGKWYFALWFFAVFFFNGGGVPPYFGAVLLVVGGLWALILLRLLILQSWRELVTQTCRALFLCVLTFLASAYWLLPLALQSGTYSHLLAKGGGLESILAWENMVDRSASWSNMMRMQGIPDWYENPSHTYSTLFLQNPVFIVLSFLPLFLIVLGWSAVKEKKIPAPFLISSALMLLPVTLFFASGTGSPLSAFFILLFHIPGFAVFRSAFYKFGPAYLFFFVVLFSYFAHQFIALKIRKPKVRAVIQGTLLGVYLLYHWPFWSSNFFAFNPTFTTKVSIPEYVREMTNYIRDTVPRSDRILLLPGTDANFPIDSYTWKFWSLDILPRLLLPHEIVVNDSSYNPVLAAVYQSWEKQDYRSFLRLLHSLGIKKILVRLDAYPQDDQNHTLESISGVRLERFYGSWYLYSVDPEPDPEILQLYTQIQTVSEIPPFPALSLPFVSGEKGNDIPRFMQKSNVLFAHCQNCTKSENATSYSFSVPYANFLPGSFGYPMVRLVEHYNEWSSFLISPQKGWEQQKMTALKRLKELEKIPASEAQHTKQIAHDFTEQLRDLHSTYIRSFAPHGVMQNEYLAYLSLCSDTLRSIQGDEPHIREALNTLESTIQRTKESVGVPSVLREPLEQPSEFIYVLSVEREGLYRWHTEIPGVRVSHNGAPLSSDELYLSSGEHTFHITGTRVNPGRFTVYTLPETRLSTMPVLDVKETSSAFMQFTLPERKEESILVLQQNASSGWGLLELGLPSQGFIPKRLPWKRLVINEFMQGWLVPAGDKQTVWLIYWSHTFFLIGTVITVSSMCVLGYYAVAVRKK